jgi:hypothetical protein
MLQYQKTKLRAVPAVSSILVRSSVREPGLLEQAGRLRHQAYLRQGHIDPRPGGLFLDEGDRSPGSETLVALADGQLLATLRIQRRRPDEPLERLSVAHAFRSELAAVASPHGLTLEMNRFAAAPGCQGLPRVKVALFKAALACAMADEARVCVAGVRSEHKAFYERHFGMVQRGGDAAYPGLKFRVLFLTCTMADTLARAMHAFPAILPSPAELQRWRRQRELLLALRPHRRGAISAAGSDSSPFDSKCTALNSGPPTLPRST